MAWPTLFAIVQVIGCPAADADRVGALIDLELGGLQADAIEVRCGRQLQVTVKAGTRTRSRALPGDALQADGGPRLVAVAAADLADELATAPDAITQPVAPTPSALTKTRSTTMPATKAAATQSRWQIAGAFTVRADFEDLRLGAGLVGRWIDDWRLIELAGVYHPRQRKAAVGLNADSRLAQLSMAAGFVLGPDGGLQSGGVLGWSAGWGWLRGSDDGGMRVGPRLIGRSVDGPVGGPFVGARVLRRFGPVMTSLSVDQGWTAWTLTGTFFGREVDAFEGIWVAVSALIGVEF